MTKKSTVHPGRILRETVFPESGISISGAASALGEPEIVLRSVLAEEMPLTAALCLKIARLFNSSPEMWIRLQASYDLQQARLDESIAASVQRIVPALPQPRAVA